jgi:hypothetical protein
MTTMMMIWKKQTSWFLRRMEVLDPANHKIIITGCNDDDDGNYDDDDVILVVISPCFLKGRVEAPVNFLRSQHLKKRINFLS